MLGLVVVDAADGWAAFESGVAAVMVVEVEPACKGSDALAFGAVEAGVGPFVEEGVVEAFDLAVGLGSVGASAGVADAVGVEDGLEGVGAVAEGVVGEDSSGGDAVVGGEGDGSGHEPGGGGAAFVSEDLGVGEAGVVVDGRVDVGVADVLAVPAGGGPPKFLVSAAFGDSPEFLDVDVDEIPGSLVLVAADRAPGGAIQPVEAVQAVAREDLVDRRGWDTHDGGQASRPQRLLPPQGGRPAARWSAWSSPGSGGDDSSGRADRPRPLADSGPPPRGGLEGDAHLGGHMRDRATTVDPLDEDFAAGRGQLGVTVSHESLRRCGTSTSAHLLPEALALVDLVRLNKVRGQDA